jgi:DNA-binding CsgD family transcriptional regulator
LLEVGDDLSLRAALHRDLSFVLVNAGNPEGMEFYWPGVELAKEAGNAALLTQLQALSALAEFQLGKGVREDLIELSLRAAAWTEHQPMELRPRVAVSHIRRWTDDLAGARALLMEEYKAAMDRGAETDLPLVLIWLVEVELWAGRWEMAERYAEQGVEAAQSSGAATPLAFVHGARAMVRACRGHVEAARHDAAAAADSAQRYGWQWPVMYATHALATLELSLGNAAAAHAVLEPISQVAQSLVLGHPGITRFVPDDVEALVRLGELATADRFLLKFEEAARNTNSGWGLATTGRCRALLAAERADHEAAAAALDAAFAAHRRIGMPFELARTHLVAGEVHRRARRKQAASQHACSALDIFQDLGASLWSRRAEEELDRLGTRRSGRSELTTVERRVAELVAAGRTNREVARELFMGLRTVETHLGRAYSKLGVHRRTQLAPALAELDSQSR